MKFSEFGFEPGLLEGITAMGFTEATPVQEKAIPVVLQGRDLIASAQTGTGKTAAFLLPVLQKILSAPREEGQVKTLVIVPTRELAMQIDQHMEGLSYFTHLSSIAVYGGTDGASFSREQDSLSKGTDVVICTPGRMLSHLSMGYVKVSGLKYLILDEADRMLDMGFYSDILRIISYLPNKRQNLMFAATMPSAIRDLAGKILNNPVEVNIALSKPAEKILQLAYVVHESQKIPMLKYLLERKQLRSILIFCNTKDKAKKITRELKNSGHSVEEIHSDLDQDGRERVLLRFKNRQISILVATNIVSRGIDIDNIDLVINMDVPGEGEDYIHRIGRTARAEAEGAAVTLIGDREQRQFQQIEELLGKPVYKGVVPVQLGEVPEYNPVRSGKSKSYGAKRNFKSKR